MGQSLSLPDVEICFEAMTTSEDKSIWNLGLVTGEDPTGGMFMNTEAIERMQ